MVACDLFVAVCGHACGEWMLWTETVYGVTDKQKCWSLEVTWIRKYNKTMWSYEKWADG
jgi:hypothetical protein